MPAIAQPSATAPHKIERATYSIVDAAERLGISRRSVYTLIDRGELPSFRIAGRRLILVSDLDAFLAAARAQVAA